MGAPAVSAMSGAMTGPAGAMAGGGKATTIAHPDILAAIKRGENVRGRGFAEPPPGAPPPMQMQPQYKRGLYGALMAGFPSLGDMMGVQMGQSKMGIGAPPPAHSLPSGMPGMGRSMPSGAPPSMASNAWAMPPQRQMASGSRGMPQSQSSYFRGR